MTYEFLGYTQTSMKFKCKLCGQIILVANEEDMLQHKC
jgi:hypothetical protein